jgi:hypothetical protein
MNTHVFGNRTFPTKTRLLAVILHARDTKEVTVREKIEE